MYLTVCTYGDDVTSLSFGFVRMSLSDIWDKEHERPFSCIDPATASKLLVVRRTRGDGGRFSPFTVVVGLQTTRIKGIMPKGLEVELELLGVKGTVK